MKCESHPLSQVTQIRPILPRRALLVKIDPGFERSCRLIRAEVLFIILTVSPRANVVVEKSDGKEVAAGRNVLQSFSFLSGMWSCSNI